MADDSCERPEILRILDAGGEKAVREYAGEMHPADIAEQLAEASPEDVRSALDALDPETGALVFSHMPESGQIAVLDQLGRAECAALFAEMPPDDRAQLYRHLPDELQERVMPALARAAREDIRRLASYPEGTAGSIMTSDYATLSPDITAGEAVERLRQAAPDKETIYYAYVVNRAQRLLGFVSLKDLIVARRDTRVRDLLHADPVSIRVDEDREVAVREMRKFDLIALPVVNRDGSIVGIITHDDVIDVVAQEQTEDIEKMAAIGGSHGGGTYLQDSSWRHYRNRVGWVVGLGIVGIGAGFIVKGFGGLLQQYAGLTAYMPMLAAAGGNTGNQSAVMVVCGLATGEITRKDLWRVLFKELAVSLLLGMVLALVVGLFAWQSQKDPAIALVVACSLCAQVVTAMLVGVLLPMGAARLKLDPAVVASPALTTVVDLTGLLMYFSLAWLLLGWLKTVL